MRPASACVDKTAGESSRDHLPMGYLDAQRHGPTAAYLSKASQPAYRSQSSRIKWQRAGTSRRRTPRWTCLTQSWCKFARRSGSKSDVDQCELLVAKNVDLHHDVWKNVDRVECEVGGEKRPETEVTSGQGSWQGRSLARRSRVSGVFATLALCSVLS